MHNVRSNHVAAPSLVGRDDPIAPFAADESGRAACPHAAAPWPKVRLGELYEVHNGLSKPKDAFGSGWPFLSYSVVFNNFFLPESLDSLVQTSEKEQESYSIRHGDVFITRTSETSDELGMSCVALKDYPHATYNGFCKRLRPITERVHPRYIGYYLRTPEFRGRFDGLGAAMITRASLRNEDLLSMTVSLPPLPIQRRIASVLGAYDDLIENNRRRIALLEKMARELYRERFVRRAGKGNTVTLGEIATITMGQSPDSSGYNSEGRGLPFHQGATGFGNRFPKNEMWSTSGKRFAEAGDILFSVRAPVGRINIATEKIIMGRGVASLRQKEGLQNWFYYALKDYFSQEDMIGVGCVFASTTKDELHAVKMQMPPVSEISVFERLIRPIDDDLWNLTEQNRSLSRQRDRLLPRLMSGKIDVEALVKEEERHG